MSKRKKKNEPELRILVQLKSYCAHAMRQDKIIQRSDVKNLERQMPMNEDDFMIKSVHQRPGFNAPFIYCDVCNEPILDATLGMVLHKTPTTELGSYCDLMYLHKGDCDTKAQARLGSDTLGWEELSRHLLQVVLNSGLSIGKLTAMREADSEAGDLFRYPTKN